MAKDERKMKMGKYISIAVSTLLWFVAAWIIISIFRDKSGDWVAYAVAAIGIVMLVVFTITTFNVLGFSLGGFFKSLKTIKQEKGLWKILTIVFRIAMLVFAVLIVIFWLVWFIYMLKDGFGKSIDIEGKPNKIQQFGLVSMLYINGPDGASEKAAMAILGLAKSAYPLYVTSFVFVLIWAAAGITFEILKKFLGGYRGKKEDKYQAVKED